MVSANRSSYGNKNFKLAELQYHRAHIYASVAAMEADVGTAVGRVVYCVETARHYFGKPGAWIGLAAASSFGDTVADLASLPPTAANGDVRVVLDDGSGVPTLYIFDEGDDNWHLVADTRLVLKDGSVLFDGIPGVEDENVQVPTNDNDLVTKKYSDDELDAHKADAAAHAAAIAAAVSAGTGGSIATHNADPAAHSATIATAVNGAVATHNSDPTAHATQISTAVDAGIATHDAAVDAHHETIISHIEIHDQDPYAHHAFDEAVPTSRSGDNVKGGQFAIEVAHGEPLSFDNTEGRYVEVGRAERPVALAWRPSSMVTLGSVSATFDNSDANVVGFATAGLEAGWFIRFPGSALNTGLFRIDSIGGGSELILDPPPVDETIATTAEYFKDDAIVVFNGRFEIDRDENIAVALDIAEIIDDIGDGNGAFSLDTPIDGKRLRKGDEVVIAGTASCDGTYEVLGYDYEAEYVIIRGPFPAAESGVGTADITHNAQTHDFDASPTTPVAFYADVDATNNYSDTAGNYLLGKQIDENTFVVNIERVDMKSVATVTGDITLDAEIYQFVPVAIVTPAQTITLPPGAEGMIVDLKDTIGGAVANNFTIEGNGAETIDGAANVLVSTNYAAFSFRWKGSGWYTF